MNVPSYKQVSRGDGDFEVRRHNDGDNLSKSPRKHFDEDEEEERPSRRHHDGEEEERSSKSSRRSHDGDDEEEESSIESRYNLLKNKYLKSLGLI